MRDEKGRFKKGFGGRKKGSKNKVGLSIKEKIREIIDCQLDEFTDLLGQLDPKDRIDAIVKLMPYVLSREKDADSRFMSMQVTVIKPPTPKDGYEIDDDS